MMSVFTHWLPAADPENTHIKADYVDSYDTPAIIELGSVADFTRDDQWALANDGLFLHRNTGGGGGTPTS